MTCWCKRRAGAPSRAASGEYQLRRPPDIQGLKTLEALEKATEKIGTISVYGGLDGVLNELVRIKREGYPGR